MNLIFTNPVEHSKWTKENYQRACMTLASIVPIYSCAAMPFPWVSYWTLTQTPNHALFCPQGVDLSKYIKKDGTLDPKLDALFKDFCKKIDIQYPYNDIIYAGSVNLFQGKADSAIWVGFSKDFPTGPTFDEFEKYIKSGRAYFINADTGEIEDLGPPWKVASEPHFTQVEGDIFEGKWDYMIHCANCYHAMKSGIAATISRDYPEAVEADNKTIKDESKIGTFSEACLADGRRIINLYGQSGIGNDGHPLNRNARYDAIYNGLFLLFETIKNEKDGAEVAIPHGMCCGLAGGEWDIVEAIIKSLQKRFSARVTIFRKVS